MKKSMTLVVGAVALALGLTQIAGPAVSRGFGGGHFGGGGMERGGGMGGEMDRGGARINENVRMNNFDDVGRRAVAPVARGAAVGAMAGIAVDSAIANSNDAMYNVCPPPNDPVAVTDRGEYPGYCY